jgi:hypothetical protein
MSHHCPFPVRSTDNRRCYQTGSAPGFVLCLALAAALLCCYIDFGYAAQPGHAQANNSVGLAGIAVAIDTHSSTCSLG